MANLAYIIVKTLRNAGIDADLLMQKYPPQDALPLPMPTPADVRIFRVTPTVISVLDYSKGFGHTDLVTC